MLKHSQGNKTKQRAKKQWHRVELVVQDRVEALALEGYSAAQIHRHLSDDYSLGQIPTLRTVQNIVTKLRRPDLSGGWGLADVPPEHARLVLDVLCAAIEESQGRLEGLSHAEADQIILLHAAAPGLERGTLWRLARLYQSRIARGEGTADLDNLLAFAPWQQPAGWQRYYHAVVEGWIRVAPNFVIEAIRGEPSQPEVHTDDDGQEWVPARVRHDEARLQDAEGLADADQYELVMGHLQQDLNRRGDPGEPAPEEAE